MAWRAMEEWRSDYASCRRGYIEGAWRDPSVPETGGVDIDHYAHLAALAEGAAFHFVFLADSPSVVERDNANIARAGRNDTFEPITLLSALSAKTKKIGVVATATTSCHHLPSRTNDCFS